MFNDELTPHERLLRTFKGEAVDRAPVKLWGLDLGMGMLRPAYQKIYDYAHDKTDLFSGGGSPMDIFVGTRRELYETKVEPWEKDPVWNKHITTLHTPDGDLRCISLVSTKGDPGYVLENYVKNSADLKKLFSIPYAPYEMNVEGYLARRDFIGEKGIVSFGLDHAGYALHRMCGSEMLGYLYSDDRAVVLELAGIFAERVYNHCKAAIEKLRGYKTDDFVVSYVGPEVLTPPLMNMQGFEEIVCENDKKLHDLVHGAGGYVWMHCHGNMKKVIKRFADIGIDLLNPVEPPPHGDMTFEEAFLAVEGRMSLEGNIEIQDLLCSDTETIKALVEESVKTGAKYGRFVLCPSAGYMEYTEPTDSFIDNVITYVGYGLEMARKYHY
ncbi:MAG: hypothetical protein FWG34_06110 [Oscillospiraceae bacterium]|nr:hypothetical protein [Oscillospiraceae bacterium]